MCIAIPGRVVAIDGQTAQVDFKGNNVPVNIGLVEPEGWSVCACPCRMCD